MSKVIVTTTINGATPALDAYSAMSGWHLLVVLDRETPNFSLPNTSMLSIEDQERLDRELSDLIGWNCIQRRNMGFLLAYRWGADLVATVDDDNIPLAHWGTNVRVGQVTSARSFTSETTDWFDPLAVTAHAHLWHRGFPLPELAQRNYAEAEPVTFVPDIEASLWLGDPDVDAICRLEHRPEIEDYGTAFPLSSPLIGPFNSQNTFLSRAALREYFCFPDIGRFDDIWASYHAQAQGLRVIYTAPSVRQLRNSHDPLVDMKHEMWGYLHTPLLLQQLRSDPNAACSALPPRALAAFDAYRHHIRGLDGSAGTPVERGPAC